MRSTSRGVVLVAVMWVVLLLTVVATTVVTRSMERRWAAARLGQAAQLDASSDSAIRLTLLAAIGGLREGELPRPIPTRIALGPDEVEVRLHQESRRLDLNAADDAALAAYFSAAGWNAEDADALVSRIRDWQDPDDVVRPSGIERDGYAASGMRGSPRNGPMEVVEEVRRVAGGEQLTDDVLDGLTVYSHLDIPTVDAARLAVASIVRIRACARREELRRCREAVVRLTGSTEEPVQVFSWRIIPASAEL